MHAKHPEIAEKWDKEYPNQKNLPEKVDEDRKTEKQKRREKKD